MVALITVLWTFSYRLAVRLARRLPYLPPVRKSDGVLKERIHELEASESLTALDLTHLRRVGCFIT